MNHLPKRSAFTLIELLVVISIIAILASLAIPAASGAIDRAKKAQAQNAATQIATAIIGYETEYGHLPTNGTSDDSGYANLFNVLGNIGSASTENPRGIVFLEIPDAKNGKNGLAGNNYKDPWGNTYVVVMDGNYDNSITVNGETLRKKVAVYSNGKDKQAGTTDDAKSW